MNDQLDQARRDYERATPNPLIVPCVKELQAQHERETGTKFHRSALMPMKVNRVQMFVMSYGIGVLIALGLILYFVR